jgi:dipeptidyl aminopeptidase/acylaminoacyl peptidase
MTRTFAAGSFFGRAAHHRDSNSTPSIRCNPQRQVVARFALMRALVLVLVASCSSVPHHYTLRQFLEVRRSNTASLSPDASRVAFVTNTTGSWQAWIAPASGGAPRQITRFPDRVAELLWSPAGEDILVTSDHDGDQQFQLYVVSADGGAPRVLTSAPDVKHDVGGWSRDGKFVFYASNARDRRYFDCYLLDVQTRQARRVLERDALLRAAALSPDARWIAAVERTSEVDQNVYVADTETGAARLITPHDGAARFQVVGFGPDASELYVLTDIGREFLGLAAIDLATGALRFLETEAHDTDVAVVSRDGHRIALSHNVEGYADLVVLVDGRPVAIPGLPRGIVAPNEFSADGKRLAVVVTTPTHDDDIFVIDLERRAVSRVTHSDQAGIAERDLVVPTLVHFPARDGRSIPAFLYLPPRAGARLPVIVSIHGGPEDQERPWFYAWYQYFVGRGYAVLAPNIRGSAGYGKSYLALDNGARRWDALADIAAAVAWLRARPDVDGRRIVAFGASYGGFAVLAMLAHHPDLFAAGVDFYGPSDLATFLGRTAEYRRGQRAAEYGDPQRDAAFLAEISPVRHVDRITAPLLIVQGANDPIVPPAESEQLVELLRARGRTVRYLVFPDEGHGFVKQPNEIRAFEEMVAFLDELWTRPR